MNTNGALILGPGATGQSPIWTVTQFDIVDWKLFNEGVTLLDDQTIRHLFLSQKKVVVNQKALLLPGTMLVRCHIKTVNVTLGKSVFTWTESSAEELLNKLKPDKICEALLLLQAKPEDWQKGMSLTFPTCTCLAGEIDLNLLNSRSDLSNFEQFLPNGSTPPTPPTNLKLTASGLLCDAVFRFKWQKQTDKSIQAPLWLAPFFDQEKPTTQLYVTLDREVMRAEQSIWQEATSQLTVAFQALADTVRPKKTDQYWTSLILLSQTAIPQFFWEISPNATTNEIELQFPAGEWQVLVADQNPAEDPQGLLTLVPAVTISGDSIDITITFEDVLAGTINKSSFFKFSAKDNPLNDQVEIANIVTEYESLSVAERLRQQYNLPTPDPTTQATSPAILWGCMPLADGWAQLPFLNLTDQHYFDALPQRDATTDDQPITPSPLLTGAAIFGNDAPERYDPTSGEQPWSITLLNGKGYTGTWVIHDGQLKERTLTVYEPDVVLNGFLRLNMQSPDELDVLPDMDNFLADLSVVSLRTVQSNDRFPAPFQLYFDTLLFSNSPVNNSQSKEHFSKPVLRNWQFAYRTNPTQTIRTLRTSQIEDKDLRTLNKQVIDIVDNNEEVTDTEIKEIKFEHVSTQVIKSIETTEAENILKKLLRRGLWSRLANVDDKINALWQYKPLVWRRHPHAPLIQTLPLTQPQLPPSHPSPSRQLAPFELTVSDLELTDAVFSVSKEAGASDWVSWSPPLMKQTPATEWTAASSHDPNFLGVQGLASLGLPGLMFYPSAPDDPFNQATVFLPAQLLFSLPYTDELNALAQLPNDAPEQNSTDGLPTGSTTIELPVEKPVLVPRREFFGAYWQQLGEKAALAKTDADKMLKKTGDHTFVTNLIEPFDWEVQPTLAIETYPGTLTLKNAADNQQLVLTGKTALNGISGHFKLVGQQLQLSEPGEGTFEVVSGSMVALGDGVRLCDQRGWWRGPSTATGNILKTPLEQLSNGPSQFIDLCSLLTPVPLQIGLENNWNIWFRDLPVDVTANSFIRKTDDSAQDINNPVADSSQLNAWNGYEWRVSNTDETTTVSLLGFLFFPLTLETVTLENDQIRSLVLLGRIQLPEEKPLELPEYGNVVRVTFNREQNPALLTLATIETESVHSTSDPQIINGIWPLKSEADSFAPHLYWQQFSYSNNAITLKSQLAFYLFGTQWVLNLREKQFAPGQSSVELQLVDQNSSNAIRFTDCSVTFDEKLALIKAELDLTFEWGNDSVALPAGATLTINLLNSNSQQATILFDTNELNEQNKLNVFLGRNDSTFLKYRLNYQKASLTATALQIEFTGFDTDSFKPLDMLPGMSMPTADSCSGFAVMSFSIDPVAVKDAPISGQFIPQHGSVEAVFNCRWGSTFATGIVDAAGVFSSSGGNLCAGYTLQTIANGNLLNWKASLLLNGVVDVNNLLSYPQQPLFNEPSLALGTAQFALNSDEISPADNSKLEALANLLKTSNAINLSIEGHTDNSGSEKFNLTLSERRAQAVKDFFKDLGVNVDTTVTTGFGESLPLNDTNNALNRRAEVYLSTLPVELRIFFFDKGSDQINAEQESRLKNLAELVTLDPTVQLRLEGYANDSSDTDTTAETDNVTLSQKRAEAITKALKVLNITDDRLTILSFGQRMALPNQPAQDNDRRVEIHLFYSKPNVFLFEPDETALTPENRIKLKKYVDLVRSNPAIKLSVEGHTDSNRSADTNTAFALARANVVEQRLLLLMGIQHSDRITVSSFGETMPVADNQTTDGQKANRRVEIHSVFASLPAVRPAITPLNHVRHTIRILLNQHEIPSEALQTGSATLLFNFAPTASWQFLAVVEHRLVDITFLNSDGLLKKDTYLKATNDRRWSVVQEIRWNSPQKLSNYLNQFLPDAGAATLSTTFPAHTDLTVRELAQVSSAFQYKPFLNELLNTNGNQITKLTDTLLIEASAVQQVLSLSNKSANFINLQYLPTGIQQAVLTLPDYFLMPVESVPGNGSLAADWSLLALPFLGRLQPDKNDWFGPEPQPQSESMLAVDPILFLYIQRQTLLPLPQIPLALASRGDTTAIPVTVSLFDITRFRRFKRLDQSTLLESWFRLQNPPSEDLNLNNNQLLSSVTAALPADAPSRSSRETVLKRLFSEQRDAFPPAKPTNTTLIANNEGLTSSLAATDPLSWRRNAQLTWQGVSSLIIQEIDTNPVSNHPHSFYFTAAQIHSFATDSQLVGINRFPSVTLLPANLVVDGKPNHWPVSFAVSPYLGFDYVDLTGQPTDSPLLLSFAELLCLDQAGKRMISIGSRVWEHKEPAISTDTDVLLMWAQAIKNRLAADSPLAVLRIRKVFGTGLVQFPRIAYEFCVLTTDEQSLLTVDTPGGLRLPLAQLRFAEGQFRPGSAPSDTLPIELAPPQVKGVQPIYVDSDTWNKQNKTHWSWDLSTLRISISYAHDDVGLVGDPQKRLWWSALSHRVQFATPPEIPSLLPAKFRERAILSLLPVAPNLSLPTFLDDELPKAENETDPAIKALQIWQPILPGSHTYFVVGARAGVPFMFRNMLLRQDLSGLSTNQSNQSSATHVAGGIPVQHRMPRPVVLPENPPPPLPSHEDTTQPVKPASVDPLQIALQTWGSYFDPLTTVNVSSIPFDNTFIVDKQNQGHSLEISLEKPTEDNVRPQQYISTLQDGIICTNHNGQFPLKIKVKASEEEVSRWEFYAELIASEQKPSLHLKLNVPIKSVTDNPIHICFAPDNDDKVAANIMRTFLSNLPHGSLLQLIVTATPPAELVCNIRAYSQRLVFPLRLAQEDILRDPFQYQFLQFEDPEYNRRLVSQAAQSIRDVSYHEGGLEKKIELTLAADRREYNPSSEIFLAIFSSDATKIVLFALTVKWMNSYGVPTVVATRSTNDTFVKFSLTELQNDSAKTFRPGDSILITLDKINEPATDVTPIFPSDFSMSIRLELVKEPVTPVSEAAYALLRRNEALDSVECVRFAWSPQPARIDLLTPLDLKTGIVRRRAIFQWIDTLRYGRKSTYGLQKITSSGSTSFDILP